jgi:hypothetical protein
MHDDRISMTKAQPVKHFADMNGTMAFPLCCAARLFSRLMPACIYIGVALFSVEGAQDLSFGSAITKNTIAVYADTMLDSVMFAGFTASLISRLEHELSGSEYVVLPVVRGAPGRASTDSLLTVLVVRAFANPPGPPMLRATLMRASAWGVFAPDTQYQPLVNFACAVTDTASAALLVARKIAENLRGRSSCRLHINSIPTHAFVRSATGLNGQCPLDWDVAFGIVDMTASSKGYLDKTVRLKLSDTRIADTALVVLDRRMIYHSRVFYPAIGLGVLSAALYGCEYYYYQKYRRLDANDLANNPGSFGNTFNIAQGCGYGAGICLGLSAALFCVTFFW